MGNNEIATQDEFHTDLSVLPPQPSQQTQTAIARQVLRDHAELSDMAWQFANKLVGTKMVPVRFRAQPEEATAAILYGAELGLGPISALQNIFEVHGSPGIYARTAQALLEAKGFQFRTVESTNEIATVHGWKPGADPKLDEPDEWSTFTYEDAERAGWAPRPLDADKGGIMIRGIRYEENKYGKLDGNEKYLTQPRQMLWAKAMMETCRHLSPATLLGIAYCVEELESERSASPEGTGPSRPVAEAPLTVEEILSAAPERPANGLPLTDTLAEREAAEDRAAAVADAVLDAAEDDSEPAEVEVEPEPTPPAPVKQTGKRAAAAQQREQKARLKDATKKLPKDAAARVAAAVAKATAAQNGGGTEGTEVPETTPVADPEPVQSPVESPEPSEMPVTTEDPSTGDGLLRPDLSEDEAKALDDAYADELADQYVGPAIEEESEQAVAARQHQEAAETGEVHATEPVKAPTDWDGSKPATREQLSDLTACIAAAGYQPTDDGRAEWFAWLSQEVDRDVTRNNQLSRREIDKVIAVMRADQQA